MIILKTPLVNVWRLTTHYTPVIRSMDNLSINNSKTSKFENKYSTFNINTAYQGKIKELIKLVSRFPKYI